VFEAMRLREDLSRAGINNKWWVVNQSLSAADVSNPMLAARAAAETAWIDKVQQISDDNFVVIPWLQDPSIQNIGNFID
jgi:arsenite-transporting ATPase